MGNKSFETGSLGDHEGFLAQRVQEMFEKKRRSFMGLFQGLIKNIEFIKVIREADMDDIRRLGAVDNKRTAIQMAGAGLKESKAINHFEVEGLAEIKALLYEFFAEFKQIPGGNLSIFLERHDDDKLNQIIDGIDDLIEKNFPDPKGELGPVVKFNQLWVLRDLLFEEIKKDLPQKKKKGIEIHNKFNRLELDVTAISFYRALRPYLETSEEYFIDDEISLKERRKSSTRAVIGMLFPGKTFKPGRNINEMFELFQTYILEDPATENLIQDELADYKDEYKMLKQMFEFINILRTKRRTAVDLLDAGTKSDIELETGAISLGEPIFSRELRIASVKEIHNLIPGYSIIVEPVKGPNYIAAVRILKSEEILTDKEGKIIIPEN